MKTTLLISAGIIIGIALIALGNRGGGETRPPASHEIGDLAPTPEQQSALDELERNAVVLGEADAPVTLIEFGDYQCTFCTKFFNETKSALEEKYIAAGKLKMIFVDFAINGRESVNAAEASWCAHEQGRYWEYHNKLYQERKGYNVGVFRDDNLIGYAGELGLDTASFSSCYEARTYRDKVAESTREAPLFGARGTPTFLLNGQLIPGAQPLSFFENAIEQTLSNLDNSNSASGIEVPAGDNKLTVPNEG